VLLTADSDEYFVNEPSITQSAFASLQGSPITRSKLEAPAANGLVRNLHPALGEQVFDVAEAQAESVIQPNRMADNRW